MHAYDQVEYSDVALWFTESQIQELVAQLAEQGITVAWKETGKYFFLSVQTGYETHRFTFKKVGRRYRLRNRHYNIKDQSFEKILQHFIEQSKGHAVVKMFFGGQLVVQRIRYGEADRIIKISGGQREVIFEKECTVTVEDVMEALKRCDAEERIPVLELEIDCELAILYEALHVQNKGQIEVSKSKLCQLHQERIMLEV
jgi:hypothetical protein